MNIEFISTSLKPICEGCLSVDRKLKSVSDPEIRRFFKELIDPLLCYSDYDHLNHPSALCWECTAIIKRTLRYKKQVQHAHGHLVQYMLRHITTPPRLSNLTVCTNPPEFYFEDNKETVPNDSKMLETSENYKSLEIPFLKVEGKDEEFDYDGYVVHVDAGDMADDFKDVIQSSSDNTNETKTQIVLKQSNTDLEEFGESDEEPLKKRAEGEDGKKYNSRGRRKQGTKTDEKKPNKASKARREKPSGVVRHPRVARKLHQLNVPDGQLEMVVLSWEEVEAERQAALQKPSYTRHAHRCELCALGFNHRFKLDNHMKKHDPSSGALQCGACGCRSRAPHALAAHRRRHRVRWRCVQCGARFSRAAVAADHVSRAHGAAAASHACPICEHVAPTLGKLRNHMKNHSERPKCDLCGKTFRDKASLRTHLFIHKGEKEYSCEHCGKQFLFKKAMQLHQVTHEAPAHLYCHQCDVTFKNKMTYYQHMKYNLKHIDPAKLKHVCATCGKRFTKAARLAEHNTAVHLKATPVSCTMPDCRFACSSRTVLRTHVRMVHRNLRDVKNHVCHTCGKAYKTKTSLEGHLRAHSGERPFACSLCTSTFAYEAALYNHNKLVHLKAKKSSGEPSSGSVGIVRRSSASQPLHTAPAPDDYSPLIGTIKVTNIY